LEQKIMIGTLRIRALSICATAALLAACTGNDLGAAGPNSADGAAAHSHLANGRFLPHWSPLASLIPPELRTRAHYSARVPEFGTAATHRKGLYVSAFYDAILGYSQNNRQNKPPFCEVSGGYANNVAVDRSGNLIVPDGSTNQVTIFSGPDMCGPQYATFQDAYGQPSAVASDDAISGTIAVANIFDSSGQPGSIALCSISYGCTSNLTNADMYEVAGVAMARNGDCWADAVNAAGTATLTYFKSCVGAGVAARGFLNHYYGGLAVDAGSNLLSVSTFDSKLYVYKGCNPRCTLLGGPFALEGEDVFVSLNGSSTMLAGADFEQSRVDVYTYSSSSGVAFEYSFDNGLGPSPEVEGVAYSPSTR
jgi:hypothetical protein